MKDLTTELVRNLVGFTVILAGILVTALGAHWHIDKMTDAGIAFFPAALLALTPRPTKASVGDPEQVKRSPSDPKE